ncbi:MAG: hypothetical protein FWC51_03565 [Proteobacteria bacterium]|nr:hypothetical protein [Pseudomonadota bacterium]
MKTGKYQLLEIYYDGVWSWNPTEHARFLAPNHPYRVYYREIYEDALENGEKQYLCNGGYPEFATLELAQNFMESKIQGSVNLCRGK